jgi:hypothetical protein
VPIPDDPKINGLGAFPICCWDARPPQSAAKVVLGTHKVLASGEGGWVFGVLCVLGAPLCERVSMLRMPDPILFVWAIPIRAPLRNTELLSIDVYQNSNAKRL